MTSANRTSALPLADFDPLSRARYVASFFAFRCRRLFESSDCEEIPPWRLSLAAAGKIALDELALAIVATAADIPAIADRRR